MTSNEIWQAIDQNQDELLAFCSSLIRIPSINPPGDVSAVVDCIRAFMDRHNLRNEIVGADEQWPNILCTYGEDNIGSHTVVFNGHCDVVPIGNRKKWSFDPFSGEIENGVMLGRGTSDMKCGLGAALFAVALLSDLGVKLNGKVLLTVVPDEETGGEHGTKWLFANSLIRGRWGIVAEPTGMDNIEVGQKGTMGMNLYAIGKTAHGSLYPYVGESAIDKLIRILPQMYALRELHGTYNGETADVMELSRQKAKAVQKATGVENIMDHVTVNIGRINGGVKRNVVADTAMAELDVRVPIGVSTEEIITRSQEIIRNSGIDGVRVEFNTPCSGNLISVSDPLVHSVKRSVASLCGAEPQATYQWASSDTRYFREAGISTIQYGPSNTQGIHNYNETVNVSDIIIACKVYASIILDLIG